MIKKNTKKAAVVANGAFPRSERALGALRAADVIVCCDGAAAKLDRAGMAPAVVIGDLDSLQGRLREKYAGRLLHESEQDTNDLCKALRYCVKMRYSDVDVFGAMGLREDHAIGNFAALAEFPGIARLRMVTDYGVFTVIRKSRKFESRKGEHVSVFVMTPGLAVTFSGLEYPARRRVFARLWEATLNASLGDSFGITLHSPGGCVIVYQAEREGRAR